jgi:hypothetical protein
MTRTRKIITASLAALTLGLGVAASSSPAAAWGCGPWGCGGGWGHHYGWGAPAAIGLGSALAIGAIAASAAPAACVSDQPIYSRHGRFLGYRRVAVAC